MKQRDKVLGIGRLIAMADLDARSKPARGFHPLRGGSGMQATGVLQHERALLGEVRARRAGHWGRHVAGERGDDVFSVARGEEQPQACVIVQQARQPAQQCDVLIRLRGNGEDQMRGLPGVPFQPLGKLQHGNARLADQVTVFAHAVRDGDAVPEKRVGHGFAAQEAVDIGGVDAAGIGQQLAGGADGAGLVGGVLLQADAFGADQGGSHAAESPAAAGLVRPGIRVINDGELKSITVGVSMCAAA